MGKVLSRFTNGFPGAVSRNKDDVVVLDADHHIPLAVYQGLNGCNTHAGSQNTIVSRRATAAL